MDGHLSGSRVLVFVFKVCPEMPVEDGSRKALQEGKESLVSVSPGSSHPGKSPVEFQHPLSLGWGSPFLHSYMQDFAGSIGRTDAEAEMSILWPPHAKN